MEIFRTLKHCGRSNFRTVLMSEIKMVQNREAVGTQKTGQSGLNLDSNTLQRRL